MRNCVFCAIAAGQTPAVIVREWPDTLAVRPRTAAVMRRAAELMAEHPAANLITSKGAAATQTVYHLHVHVVPRQGGDGLPLPWTPQHTARAAAQNGVTS
jgi:histidine triad (HIT) family protein